MANLITPLNEELAKESQVESAEDLLATLEEFNEKGVKEKVEIYSMDAKALYPSINIKKSLDAVQEIMLESKIKVENINILELLRYYILGCKIHNRGTRRAGQGGQNTSKFEFELAPKLIPFSWLSCFKNIKMIFLAHREDL